MYIFLQERDLGDEYGWKQVHGEVFRTPSFPTFLSTLIGSGYHLAAVTFIVTLLVIMGDLYMGYIFTCEVPVAYITVYITVLLGFNFLNKRLP